MKRSKVPKVERSNVQQEVELSNALNWTSKTVEGHSNLPRWTDEDVRDEWWITELDEERARSSEGKTLSEEALSKETIPPKVFKMVTLGVNGEKSPVDSSVASFLQGGWRNNGKGFVVQLPNGIWVVFYKLSNSQYVQLGITQPKKPDEKIVVITQRFVNTTFENLNSLYPANHVHLVVIDF